MALWGPLIIVGFLVLVFRGGEEREATVAAGPDASGGAASVAAAEEAVSEPRVAAPGSPASAALPPVRAPEPTIAAHRDAGVFDRGFAMPAAMAGPPVYAGRGPGAVMPAAVPGRLYPPPPGPYRDPRYRSLPTGESWSADGAGEWSWPAPGPRGFGAGGRRRGFGAVGAMRTALLLVPGSGHPDLVEIALRGSPTGMDSRSPPS